MTGAQFEIILITCLTAVACSVPGSFLVLRRMPAYSNIINYSVLLGIAVAFFFVQWIDSPIIVLAAGAIGFVIIFCVEKVLKAGFEKGEATASVLYPFVFSAAVILISLFASQAHIDIDTVLFGELAFTPFNRLQVLGYNMGPVALWQIGGFALLNAFLSLFFYKELKLVLFDYGYAATAGFVPQRMIYGIMLIVSLTAVAAFEVAGSFLSVGFTIGPAVIACYLTKRLKRLLLLAPLIGVISSLLGYAAAYTLDASIAGMTVSVMGALFFLALLFAPGAGIVAKALENKKRKDELLVNLLLLHLWQHEVLGNAAEKNSADNLSLYLNWKSGFADRIVKRCMDMQLLGINTDGILFLLKGGRSRAQAILEG